jgi:hypothetical protein
MKINFVYGLAAFALLGCKAEKENKDTGSSAPVVSGALVIEGSLANGEDPEVTDILANQKVDIVRSDNATIGSATSDANGEFSLNLGAGALTTDGFGLTSESESVVSTESFKYYLQTAVPDDGNGKALGIRRKISLTQNAVTGTSGDADLIDLGESPLKEISAITGTIAFASSAISPDRTDVYIPGKSFFARTGDDGTFQLLFLPEGSYLVRIEKGVYVKDVNVEVKSGKTTILGDVEVGLKDRDPLPLVDIIEGRWQETCYFKGAPSGGPTSDAETPSTAVLLFNAPVNNALPNNYSGGANNSFYIESGYSCLIGNVLPASSTTLSLLVPNDDVIVRKFSSAGTQYGFYQVNRYTNNRIVLQVALNAGTDQWGAIAILERLD